jgi:hypothetical protein
MNSKKKHSSGPDIYIQPKSGKTNLNDIQMIGLFSILKKKHFRKAIYIYNRNREKRTKTIYEFNQRVIV